MSDTIPENLVQCTFNFEVLNALPIEPVIPVVIVQTPLSKPCSKCKMLLPATIEFFYADKRAKDGLQSACKNCKKRYNKDHEEYNREYQQSYYQEHREENLAYQSLYQQEHIDHVLEYKRLYYRKYRDALLLRSWQYGQEHKEQRCEYLKWYFQTESGIAAKKVSSHNYRARKKAAPGTLTSQQIHQKLMAQRYRCYYAACEHARFKKVKGKYIYHLEHTVPLSRPEDGPRHDVNFIVLSCPSCNLKKHNKLPHEFADGDRLF